MEMVSSVFAVFAFELIICLPAIGAYEAFGATQGHLFKSSSPADKIAS